MDSFKIHERVIADYRGYIESFINIRDADILAVVQKALSEGRLWPEPLIQFNPSYKITGDLASIVQSESLHPALTDIFKVWGQLNCETKFSEKWVTHFGFCFGEWRSVPGSGARIPQ